MKFKWWHGPLFAVIWVLEEMWGLVKRLVGKK